MTLLLGDSLERLRELPNNSVDACVTDPPYGLAFMNKKWDYDVPSRELWAQVYRVMKPGAHLLSFGGTRTYHRMVVAIEDAGFEIRDQIMWIYGSGFPKSLDVSKAIDKAAGAERTEFTVDEDFLRRNPGTKLDGIDRKKEYSGTEFKEGVEAAKRFSPATALAKQWQGWGTALKPANEPIVLARKPLEKGLTVAQNVQRWGTGAINVDAGRIGTEARTYSLNGAIKGGNFGNKANQPASEREHATAIGRWPANVLFGCDCEARYLESTKEEPHKDFHYADCATAMLDAQSGPIKTKLPFQKTKESERGMYGAGESAAGQKYTSQKGLGITVPGASRFFYVAKASKRERNVGLEGMPAKDMKSDNNNNGNMINSKWVIDPRHKDGGYESAVRKPTANNHPTVKPIKLMEYLCKLITPPGGVILDPFMGSGTTGCAARKLGYEFIGIERERDYLEISKRRISFWSNERGDHGAQGDLPSIPRENDSDGKAI